MIFIFSFFFLFFVFLKRKESDFRIKENNKEKLFVLTISI